MCIGPGGGLPELSLEPCAISPDQNRQECTPNTTYGEEVGQEFGKDERLLLASSLYRSTTGTDVIRGTFWTRRLPLGLFLPILEGVRRRVLCIGRAIPVPDFGMIVISADFFSSEMILFCDAHESPSWPISLQDFGT